MKEVFEKIIERLQQRKVFYENRMSEMGGTDRDVEDWGSVKSYCDAIKIVNQAAEEYGNGWIPCSERLPEVNGWYLVTNELGVVQQQYWATSHWQKLRDDAVLAWQPLPNPYIPPKKTSLGKE